MFAAFSLTQVGFGWERLLLMLHSAINCCGMISVSRFDRYKIRIDFRKSVLGYKIWSPSTFFSSVPSQHLIAISNRVGVFACSFVRFSLVNLKTFQFRADVLYISYYVSSYIYAHLVLIFWSSISERRQILRVSINASNMYYCIILQRPTLHQNSRSTSQSVYM